MDDRQQKHPQYKSDRLIVDQLLANQSPGDYELAELARLKIRYQGFPGAWDIQEDLDRLLQLWNYTEDSLFEKTRAIHAEGHVYRSQNQDSDDWI